MRLRQWSNNQISIRKKMFRWAGWFTFFNAIIVIVIIGRYFRFTGPIHGALPHVYAVALLIGHPLFLAYGLGIPVLLPIILIWPNRRLTGAIGIFSAATGIAALLLDYVVYSQFRVHLNKVMLDLVIGGGREIFDFSWQNWLIAGLCVAGVLALEAIIAWFVWAYIVKRTRRLMGRTLAVIGVVFILTAHMIHAWADANFYRPVTAMSRHFPLYYPLTAKRMLQRYGLVNLAENRNDRKLKMGAVSQRSIHYPLKQLEFSTHTKPLNIVFIVIDSWRFDTLTPDVTPHIHRFISEHPVWRFTNHLSGGNGTRIGIFSLFYGLSGVHWDVMTNEQIGPVFIRELLSRNYRMGIFASAKLTTPPFNRNVFYDIKNLRSFSEGESAWERDKSVLADWSEWLNAHDPRQPFFGFIFFDAAHTYTMPPDYPVVFKPMWEQVNYLALDDDLDPVPFFNRYKVSLHFIDSLAKKVLLDLAKHNLMDNTIIVFTGDHGQEFNDTGHNFWGHGGNYTDYQIKVPMAIYWPGRDPGVFGHLTSHLDVVPTLMTDLFGCRNAMSDYGDGRHLLDPQNRDWLVVGGYFNYAIRETDRITMAYSTGNYEIFDLSHGMIENARLNYKVVKRVMDQTSRFYRN